MKPIILMRDGYGEKEEKEIAKKYFEVTDSRVNLSNRLVVGRYSVLPFYRELENDLKSQGSKLINSHLDHSYIANFDYYHDLNEFPIGKDQDNKKLYLTPESCFELSKIPEWEHGYVVKGKTNSRKHQWNGKMFVKTKKEAIELALELELNDPLVRDQGFVVRKFEPLKVFEYGINGLPFSNEWRCFFYKEKLLTVGYYWTQAQNIPKKDALPKEAYQVAQEAAKILSQRVDFFVVDIAETQSGRWIVIEVNDGQMSGLSDNSADDLYKNLAEALDGKG